MSRDSSLDKNPMEDSQDPEETCEQLEEVRQCFSEEGWTKMETADKLSYLYMKKINFMSALGLMPTGTKSMHPNISTPKPADHGLDETQNPGNHDFPGTSGTSEDLGNLYQHRSSLLYELLMNASPQEASTDQQRKDLKVEPVQEAPPVAPDSEPEPKQLWTRGKRRGSRQLRKQPAPRKEETKAWLGRLRERKNNIVYSELSDTEEEMTKHGCAKCP